MRIRAVAVVTAMATATPLCSSTRPISERTMETRTRGQARSTELTKWRESRETCNLVHAELLGLSTASARVLPE